MLFHTEPWSCWLLVNNVNPASEIMVMVMACSSLELPSPASAPNAGVSASAGQGILREPTLHKDPTSTIVSRAIASRNFTRPQSGSQSLISDLFLILMTCLVPLVTFPAASETSDQRLFACLMPDRALTLFFFNQLRVKTSQRRIRDRNNEAKTLPRDIEFLSPSPSSCLNATPRIPVLDANAIHDITRV